MKLEIKHVAPYLPYDLLFFRYERRCLDKSVTPVIWSKDLHPFQTQLNAVTLNGFNYETSKPILRPLSDLNEDNARFLSSDGYMAVCEECIYVDEMHYSDVLKLIERHYDVFGLIENGLAISYNELK